MSRDVESTIRGFLLEEIDTSSQGIDDETNIRELDGVDSITLLSVVAHVEDHYHVQFADDLVFDVYTIRQLSDAVRGLLEGANGKR